MEFLRVVEEELRALAAEARRRHPVVQEAAERYIPRTWYSSSTSGTWYLVNTTVPLSVRTNAQTRHTTTQCCVHGTEVLAVDRVVPAINSKQAG